MSALNGSHLYHYTDCAGFRGIVESNVLWATNLFFLNDSEELRHGIELLKRRLEKRRDDSDSKGTSIYEQCLDVLGSITGDCEGGSPLEEAIRFYVASFSEDGNRLSQWRAYCPKGGVAIGFRKDKLDTLARNQGFTLESCLYDDEKKGERVDRLLDTPSEEASVSDRRAVSQPFTEQEIRYGDIADENLWKILPLLPVFKHSGFFEEREWRFTSDLQAGDRPGEVKFRVGNGGLIPYREVPLVDDLWPDARIIISPGPQKDRAKLAVRQLLAHNRYPISPSQIQHSEIPYRS